MIDLIPALLVHSKEQFLKQINSIKHLVPLVQLDIADGDFVDNKTWADPEVIAQMSDVQFELHLMVSHPLQEIERWKHIPHVTRILFHIESEDPTADVINEIKKANKEVGLVINPETAAETIETFLHELNEVQFMTIHPGKQGQPFLPAVVEKIRMFHSKYPQISIGVDGHIDEKTIPQVLSAGATRLGIGSAIFNDEKTPVESIMFLRQLLNVT